eukprot:1161510-Pelagomonas_calceolata.AAC.5
MEHVLGHYLPEVSATKAHLCGGGKYSHTSYLQLARFMRMGGGGFFFFFMPAAANLQDGAQESNGMSLCNQHACILRLTAGG